MTRYFGLALALMMFGCNGADDDGGKGTTSEVDAILALTADTANGATLYDGNCALCHADDGSGFEGLGSNIQTETDEALVVESVLNGNDEGMTAFADILTDQEIADVSGFVTTGGLAP